MIRKPALLLFSLSLSFNADALDIDRVQVSDNGRSIVIQGKDFGNQPNIAVYDNFDPEGIVGLGLLDNIGSLADLNVDKQAAEIGNWELGAYAGQYDKDAYSGSYSVQLYSGNKGMRQIKAKFNPSQEVFISYWVKLSGGQMFPGDHVSGPGRFSKDSSWKLAWLIDKDFRGQSSDVCLPTHIGGGHFSLAGNDFGMVSDFGNNWWSWNEWIRLSFWIKANELNPTAPGTIHFETRSKDKGYKLRTYNKPVFDQDGPSEKAYRQVNFPGWVRSLKDDNTNIVYDDIYVAYGPSAASRVEIANKKEYSEADKIYILPQQSWSENKIKVKTLHFLDDNLDNMYLYVTDANGDVNQKGIPISHLNPSNVFDFSVN